jgi:hypothetical protein
VLAGASGDSLVSPQVVTRSAVTLGEIQAGIEPTREQDPQKAAEIESWLDLVADSYQAVLPVGGGLECQWQATPPRCRRAIDRLG